MTTVGLIGGLGPESTIDYYRRVIAAWERRDPASLPRIIVDSLDYHIALDLVARDRAALASYLADSVRRLAAAGVDFIAITANTPHIVFDELTAGSPVPLLSIVEVCAHEAARRGLRRPLLLGTRFTMAASFFPEVCARFGVDVVVPNETERAWIHERYVEQLLEGEFREETRAEFRSLIRQYKAEQGIGAVILAGTELPLLLTATTIDDLPVLDTTALHVDAIVERLLRVPPPGPLLGSSIA